MRSWLSTLLRSLAVITLLAGLNPAKANDCPNQADPNYWRSSPDLKAIPAGLKSLILRYISDLRSRTADVTAHLRLLARMYGFGGSTINQQALLMTLQYMISGADDYRTHPGIVIPDGKIELDLSTVPDALITLDGKEVTPTVFGDIVLSQMARDNYASIEPLLVGSKFAANFRGTRKTIRFTLLDGRRGSPSDGMRVTLRVTDRKEGVAILKQIMVAYDAVNYSQPAVHFTPERNGIPGRYESAAGMEAVLEESQASGMPYDEGNYLLILSTDPGRGWDGRETLVRTLAQAFSLEDIPGEWKSLSTHPHKTRPTLLGQRLLTERIGLRELERTYLYGKFKADFGDGPRSLYFSTAGLNPSLGLARTFSVRAKTEAEALVILARFLREADIREHRDPKLEWDRDSFSYRSAGLWSGRIERADSSTASILPDAEGRYLVQVATSAENGDIEFLTMLRILAQSYQLDALQ
jgi:hypothetical protein